MEHKSNTKPKLIHISNILLFLTLIGYSSLVAGPTLPEMGPIAYINEFEGRDAIFIRDASDVSVIYKCNYENEIVLTPSVSSDGKFITFLVDNGRDQKAVHILGPIEKVKNTWQADDYLVIMVRGAAWPVIKDNKSVYLSMPDQTSLVMGSSSNIYLVSAERIQQITEDRDLSSQIWPVINPEGNKLIYREIPLPDENGEVLGSVKSIIYDLRSGNREAHFVNQYVYMEQWTEQGDILFSFKEHDEKGNRKYALYNPETMETREIYRNKSRQGALSREARFLATIRPVPEGSADFDIFVTDLQSKVEVNLTQTPKESESLIGWIE